MSKKEEFLLHFPSKIFIFQQLFLWLQKVVLDLIYWIYKKFFDFACSIKLFWPPKVVHPKWAKMAKNGFFGPFDSPSYKFFFTEAYPTMVSGAFWRCHHRLPACMKWIWNSKQFMSNSTKFNLLPTVELWPLLRLHWGWVNDFGHDIIH